MNEELMAEARRKAGDRSIDDELLAYTRGELSPEDEERVRELLSSDPELARALSAPFPSEEARPGDPDFVSDDVVSRRWAALQGQLDGESAPAPWPKARPRFSPAWLALAAAVALVFIALYGREVSRTRQLVKELAAPRLVGETFELMPDGRRGGGDGSALLSPHGESVLLISPMADASEYRLELIDTATQHRLWSKTVQPAPDRTFRILLPEDAKHPGRYQLVVSGIGVESEPVTYTFRIPAT